MELMRILLIFRLDTLFCTHRRTGCACDLQLFYIATITQQQLEELYGVVYEKVMVDHAPTASFHPLRDKFMMYDDNTGDSERPQKLKWKHIREPMYGRLFSDVIPARSSNLPPRLAPFCLLPRQEGVNVFSNGAGKLFMIKLLGVAAHRALGTCRNHQEPANRLVWDHWRTVN